MDCAKPQPCYALIACAGVGARAGFAHPKQYQPVAGKAAVLHVLSTFAQVQQIAHVWVVTAPTDAFWRTHPPGPGVSIAPVGGATRAQSVLQGLQAMRQAGCSEEAWVLVHDAARCLIGSQQVSSMIARLQEDAVGGILARRVSDTLKSADGQARITATVTRTDKWIAQTPQMFRIGTLCRALMQARDSGHEVTDEASAIEGMGLRPKLIESGAQNIKLTYPEDFELAHALLTTRRTSAPPPHRVGQGWDTHRLVDQASTGRKLILGGIEIAHSKGLLGHSDADALCHAITDALLGAAALGDIGHHFPDTDAAFAGARSTLLLQRAADLVRAQGWRVVNMDATVVAQAPRLAPYIGAIRENLASVLGLHVSQVSVKAKTAEGLGAVGAGEAIEAQALVALAPTV